MNTFCAGFGEADITPAFGVPMAGYFEPHEVKEIITPLGAHAVAFRDADGTTLVLASCDVLFITDATASQIRRGIEGKYGIPPQQVLIAATHNHTGPATAELFDAKPSPEYMERFHAGVMEAVGAALDALEPAALRFGTAQESRIVTNRRLIMKDGTTHTHVTAEDMADVAAREGVADPELCVLVVENREGKSIGIVANYALHPTNVRGDRIDADYPGYFATHLRETVSPNLHVVFLNGPCGNTDSKTPFVDRIAHSPERARLIGTELGKAAQQAIASAAPCSDGSIRAASKVLTIPIKYVSQEEAELARKVLAGGEPSQWIFSKGTLRPSPRKEKVCAQEFLHIAELRATRPYSDVEVQVLRFGEIVIVGFPVELFSEFGQEIIEAVRAVGKRVFICELANGSFGYVPTRKAFQGGGYETRVGRSSQLVPDAGEMIVAAVSQLLPEVL